MIASLGNLTLWLSLLLAIVQFIAPKNYKLIKFKWDKILALGLLMSSLISFFSLMYCYIVSDFTVINVFQNSHTSKPLIYKISAVWGNHEGSMLLWVLV